MPQSNHFIGQQNTFPTIKKRLLEYFSTVFDIVYAINLIVERIFYLDKLL